MWSWWHPRVERGQFPQASHWPVPCEPVLGPGGPPWAPRAQPEGAGPTRSGPGPGPGPAPAVSAPSLIPGFQLCGRFLWPAVNTGALFFAFLLSCPLALGHWWDSKPLGDCNSQAWARPQQEPLPVSPGVRPGTGGPLVCRQAAGSGVEQPSRVGCAPLERGSRSSLRLGSCGAGPWAESPTGVLTSGGRV